MCLTHFTARIADRRCAGGVDTPASIADVVKAAEIDPDYWVKARPRTSGKFIEQSLLHYAEKRTLKHKEAILPEAPSIRSKAVFLDE